MAKNVIPSANTNGDDHHERRIKNAFKRKGWSEVRANDSWAIFKIMSEFVEGFEAMQRIRPCVSVFGSARTALPRTPFNLAFVLLGVALGVGILVSADPMETLPKATGVVLGLAVWRFVVIAVGRRPHVALAVGLLLLICLGFSVTGVLSLRELPKIPMP